MNHTRSLVELHLPACWGTVGVFDGVHCGHQAIIRHLVAGAHKAGWPAVVFTFYPHPANVLGQAGAMRHLTLPDERAALLTDLGVDHVVTLAFDRQMAAWSAGEFMQRVVDQTGIKRLLVGYDFALGRGREGTVPVLRQIGSKLGYEVETIAQAMFGNDVISSSLIRSLLKDGAVSRAAEMLGRRYTVSGQVVAGKQRGRKIGFPTANLAVPVERLLPGLGVYVTRTLVGDVWLPSVTNIGMRPTFDNHDSHPWLETHLLGFEGNLYGKELKVEFVEHLRPEMRFASVSELMQQIKNDAQQARQTLKLG